MTASDGKLVKNLWWEGDDLHCVYEDDTYHIYEGAFVMSRSPLVMEGEGIVVENMTPVFTGVSDD